MAWRLENALSSAPTLTVGNNNDSTTFSGSLSGNGSLTKIGNGELVLTGANRYSGGTTIDAGTLVATDASAIPDGALAVGAGGALIFDPTLAGSPVAASRSVTVAAVPEPSTFALLALGTLALWGCTLRPHRPLVRGDADALRTGLLGLAGKDRHLSRPGAGRLLRDQPGKRQNR